MKKLSGLLSEIEYELIQGQIPDIEITGICRDDRKIEKDCIFVCIEGMNFDGHESAAKADAGGAAVIVASKEVKGVRDAAVIKVKDTRLALALLCAAWFDHPDQRLKVIGVTGTKGKTTTTYMIKSVLERAGIKTGLIGTIETVIGDEHIPSQNTTPDSDVLQATLNKMADEGCEAVVMEASSQGFKLHRTAGITFEVGVFTNISPDHIGPGEHEDFDDYLRCKGMLFKQCKHGIVNMDDEHTKDVIKGHTCTITGYGFGEDCDIRVTNCELVNSGTHLGVDFDVKGQMNLRARVNMPGRFSVYNALCAMSVCHSLGVDTDVMKEAIAGAKVKGRIEFIKVSDDFSLMIDYAHNAMALESLLTTLREYEPGRLVCVFGCGGNRSKLRRYEMGEVSGKLADLTVITSDNPRFEKPLDIIADIVTGIKKTDGEFVEIPDRKEAIRYVIENGQKGDVIVLAGKGHEDYQEIEGVKHHMDERELIAQVLEEIAD
ncbi:MAG: UDP-N-acetylmuramoyl-L-alanyl-D-glutamate--2,6-diaminopimelate ligase [Lachnospiraceae bacterium]|nr:UDP-N-acetylmuramoyl-L-alanyl-D-glutamate--2,6-diaminopimelate ligase [Lachnospiraceae bacterium]